MPRYGRLVSLILLFTLVANPSQGQTPNAEPADAASVEQSSKVPATALSKRFRDWLEEVAPLITSAERALFVKLQKDYQRDAFIRKFWQVRDPYTETGRNELRERYEERLAFARSNFPSLQDDRARILLVHGEPGREILIRCTTTRTPAILWAYGRSDVVNFPFVLVFFRGSGGTGPARLWRPGRSGSIDHTVRAARNCINGGMLEDLVNQILGQGSEYDARLSRILIKPRPRSAEWIAAFVADSTDLPPDAALFDAGFDHSYLGRHQSRSVLQGIVSVRPEALAMGEYAGYRSYDLLLLGEVIQDGQLFESFRYQYGFPIRPEAQSVELLPMAFRRYLRPGSYLLILKLQDINGNAYYYDEIPLDVPRLSDVFEPPSLRDAETERLFAEATEAVNRGETTIRIIPPSESLLTGFVRFDTLATGDEIDRVAFVLDGNEILSKNRPPYNVELDLGPFPRMRTLRVEAVDVAGTVLTTDELEINAGRQRFEIRLVEPVSNQRYDRSLAARADVRVPDEGTLERVEFYLNEDLIATLYQEPFVQPISLETSGAVSYVRAVGYLADGNSTEDLVFINSPNTLEQVEVQFVELYASVIDRGGSLIEGLDSNDFSISEDGVKQQIRRFEKVENLPIHVGVLIDNSASMGGSLDTTRKAALRFFQEAIEPRDRAAVITFNRFPNLKVKLTSDLTTLGGGLAGLTAEGQTALYDSLMFTLYYLAGVSGQRALLLLSDGRDEVSRFEFAETLEYARRAGVTIYAIGLGIPEGNARRRLSSLAEETGGQSYFIKQIDDLSKIYERIEREMRSQYLLAYQSTNTRQDDEFRSIEVKVGRSGASVRTMSGYYP